MVRKMNQTETVKPTFIIKLIVITLCMCALFCLTACGSSYTVADTGLTPSFAIDALWQPYEESFEKLGIAEDKITWDDTGYAAIYSDTVNIFGFDMELVFFTDEAKGRPCEYTLSYSGEISKEAAGEITRQLYNALVDEYGKPDDFGYTRTLADEIDNISDISGENIADGWKDGKFNIRCVYKYENETAEITIRVTEK